MHDTLKKPRDILMVAYAVRFPELAARSRAMGGEVEMDAAVRMIIYGQPYLADRTIHRHLDRRAGPSTLTRHRASRARDSVLQFYSAVTLPLCDQNWKGSRRQVLQLLACKKF
jgi:hypothetical protein